MNDGEPDPVAKVMNTLIRQGGKPDPQIEYLLERLSKSLQTEKEKETDEHKDRS